MRRVCKIEGCTKIVVSNDLCDTHRKRVDRHGDVNAGRPKHWGEASTHPLYDSWSWLKRSHHMKAWDDFWEFVEDVGEKPSPRHFLSRKNTRFAYDKDNFYWREMRFDEPIVATSGQDYRNQYRKKWEKDDPRRFKDYRLRYNYDISIEDYEHMLEEQGGVCKICKKPETVMENGKVRQLHVDHDHDTNVVRGLLCHSCNTSLGHYDDSIISLCRVIEYLVPNKPSSDLVEAIKILTTIQESRNV